MRYGNFQKCGRIKIDLHHVYPKRYRREGTETKRVNKIDHRCWHILVHDWHPKHAIKRLYGIFFYEGMHLSESEERAKRYLLRNRSPEEAFGHMVKNFLPDKEEYQCWQIGERKTCSPTNLLKTNL